MKNEIHKLLSATENNVLCCNCDKLVFGEESYISYNQQPDGRLANVEFWCSECAKEFEEIKSEE